MGSCCCRFLGARGVDTGSLRKSLSSSSTAALRFAIFGGLGPLDEAEGSFLIR